MPPYSPSAEEILRRLAESTEDLGRAAEAGDLPAAEKAVLVRQAQLEALQCTLRSGPLDGRHLKALDQILRDSASAARALLSRREAIRAQLGEVEGERRRLAGLTPAKRDEGRGLDVSG